MARWSPYIVGAWMSVLIWTVFLLSDHPLGCSTAYSYTDGMVESALSRGKTKEMPYYRKPGRNANRNLVFLSDG